MNRPIYILRNLFRKDIEKYLENDGVHICLNDALIAANEAFQDICISGQLGDEIQETFYKEKLNELEL